MRLLSKKECTEIKTGVGGSLKIGMLVRLSNWWNLELYEGLGVKFIKWNKINIPVGGSFVYEPDENSIFNGRQKPVQLMVPLGARFTFLVR